MTPDPVDTGASEPVATGDRHDEVHFEADPNQLVVARHLAKPDTPLPAQDDGPNQLASEGDVPPVEDVAVAPESPSVWDARPLSRGVPEDDPPAHP
jgi:hypothetical protein